MKSREAWEDRDGSEGEKIGVRRWSLMDEHAITVKRIEIPPLGSGSRRGAKRGVVRAASGL